MIKRTEFVIILLNSLRTVGVADAGCFHPRQCCPGKNITCFSIDDDSPLPLRPVTSDQGISTEPVHRRHPSVYTSDHERIGTLVGQDLVSVEGSGAEIIDRYGGIDESDYLTDPSGPLQMVELGTTPLPTFSRIIFGEPFFPKEQPTEITRSRRDRVSDRTTKEEEYSLLNQHLPVIITAERGNFEYSDKDERGYHIDLSNIRYLESAHHDICYCDEACINYGDCCNDYALVCPPSACEISEWGEWSACVMDDNSAKCGNGVQTRERTVTRKAAYGGPECPPLVEKMSCFKECPLKEADITTVALLLDYQYSKTRQKLARDNVYWDLPEVAKKVAALSYYCVSYRIGWVNRNCIDKRITSKLHKGNTVCAECQPEAQLHRNNLRCASDLEDGDVGFWKLIGPKSCNGIWTRISRTDNCKCEEDFPKNDSFLLV